MVSNLDRKFNGTSTAVVKGHLCSDREKNWPQLLDVSRGGVGKFYLGKLMKESRET